MKTTLATLIVIAAASIAYAQPPAGSDISKDTIADTRTTRIDSSSNYQATSVPSDSVKKQPTTAVPKKHKQVTTTSSKKTTKHTSVSTKSKK